MKQTISRLILFTIIMGTICLFSCTKDNDPESTGTESNDPSSGGSSSGGGTSTSQYTFYKTVSALKITWVHDKVSKTTSTSIDIYKKSGKYYWKYETYGYASALRNTQSSTGGISVSRYSYKVKYPKYTPSIEYWYYFNL